MAIMMPALLLAVGIAMDLSNATQKQIDLQAHLDAAALSAISLDAEKKELETYIEDRLARSFGHSVSAKVSKSESKKTRELYAQVSYDSPNAFSGVLGKSSTAISADTKVSIPLELDSFRVRSTSANGFFDKTMSLMVRRPNETVDTLIAEYIYKHKGGPIKGPKGWVDMGEYDHAYFRMYINPHNKYFKEFCSGCAYDLRTDEAKHSHRLFVGSAQVPRNTKVDLFNTYECGGTTTHAWEDGGGAGTDYRFAFDAKCRQRDASFARITQ